MTVTFGGTARPSASLGSKPSRAPEGESGRFASPSGGRLLSVVYAVVWLGFGASVGLTITAETRAGLRAPGGIAMFLGNLTGMAGTYLALVMVLLVSRIPAVERILGQDGLIRWHRRLSPWPVSLIVAHAVLLTDAYAVATRTGFLAQIGSFVSGYSGMLIAIVGFLLLVVAAVLSISQIRRHVRREVWWTIHLGMYWALALAFLHEVALGPSFVGHPVTVVVWSVAWAATAGVVLVYRLGMPIYRTLHHDLRVAEVRNEAPGVVSIICQGKDLEGLQVAGGQFFEWRFWTGGLWWHSHPYSMSAKPQPPYIRLTVKASGDHSAALHHLRPGTRVGIEGPYGAFTAAARRHKKVVLIAGGIGITSVRSLLEDLPRRSEPVVVWRATTDADMALRTEVEELVHRLQGRLFYVVGSRAEVPLAAVLDQVRQLRGRDVYVAGSPSFVEGIGAIAMARGVPAESLHYEEYAL